MTHTGFHGDLSFGVRSSISSSVCTHSSRLTMQPLHPVSACTPPNTQNLLNLTLSAGPADEKLKPRQTAQKIEIYIIHRHLRLCYRLCYSGLRPKQGTFLHSTPTENCKHASFTEQTSRNTHIVLLLYY